MAQKRLKGKQIKYEYKAQEKGRLRYWPVIRAKSVHILLTQEGSAATGMRVREVVEGADHKLQISVSFRGPLKYEVR